MCKVYALWIALGVAPVTFEVRYYYIHSTVGDRVESCVRVRHHRYDRASHSDRLMQHAAHVRVHLIAHVTIAPLHACSRSRSRVQASARDSMLMRPPPPPPPFGCFRHACLPTSMLTRGTCAEASPRLPRRRAMRARTPIKGQAPAASSRRAFAAATPRHARKACQMPHAD